MGERILICGDRNWTNVKLIEKVLSEWLEEKTIDCIIEGEAKGADSIARMVAERAGIKVLPFPADWKRLKKAAGPIRNLKMLREGKPTAVLAFHNDLSRSKGTKNMVELAEAAGVYTEVISEWGEQA